MNVSQGMRIAIIHSGKSLITARKRASIWFSACVDSDMPLDVLFAIKEFFANVNARNLTKTAQSIRIPSSH
jgi:hypothetical protein